MRHLPRTPTRTHPKYKKRVVDLLLRRVVCGRGIATIFVLPSGECHLHVLPPPRVRCFRLHESGGRFRQGRKETHTKTQKKKRKKTHHNTPKHTPESELPADDAVKKTSKKKPTGTNLCFCSLVAKDRPRATTSYLPTSLPPYLPTLLMAFYACCPLSPAPPCL